MKISALVTTVVLNSCGEEENVPNQLSTDCWLTSYQDDHQNFALKYDAQERIIRTDNFDDLEELQSVFEIDYSRIQDGYITIEKNRYDGTSPSQTNLMIRVESSLPVEYDLNENDKAILDYDAEKLLKRVTFHASYYEFTYDNQKKNIVQVVRFADNIKTGTLTIKYDDKKNPFKNLWVLAASTGFGYFDDFHIYFSKNNPIEYSYEDSGSDDFQDIFTYEYEHDLPISSTINSSGNGSHSRSSGILMYTCN